MLSDASFAKMYTRMLTDVLDFPDYMPSPRGKLIFEAVNRAYCCTNPYSNIFYNTARPFPKLYLSGELLWYFTGDNSLDTISKYSGFWSNIANSDGTLNSAYGNLIFNKHNDLPYSQWEWAYNSLVNDKDTRQSIMYFGRPDFQVDDNKDFPCTVCGVYSIRDNRLNFHIYMRSNDLIKGVTFDVPFFMLLQQQMLQLLKPHYPDLQIGNYYHNVTSLHLYSADYKLARSMLESGIIDLELPKINANLVDNHGVCLLKKDTTDELYNWLYKTSEVK